MHTLGTLLYAAMTTYSTKDLEVIESRMHMTFSTLTAATYCTIVKRDRDFRSLERRRRTHTQYGQALQMLSCCTHDYSTIYYSGVRSCTAKQNEFACLYQTNIRLTRGPAKLPPDLPTAFCIIILYHINLNILH